MDIKNGRKKETDLKVLLDELMCKIIHKLPEVKKCDENEGTVVFDVVPFFDGNNKPSLYFEKDFLDIVHYLNARIQIDMYVE